MRTVRRPPFAAVALVLLVLGAVPAGGSGDLRHAAAASTRLLGITGDVARFKNQTGQESQVRQAFLGWGQGQAYGSQFAALLRTLGPIPMLHLGTGGRSRSETITPQAIAAGQGDGYLIALCQAIAAWGKGIYVRPLAEMNNAGTFYSGYRRDGSAKDAAHSPASFRKAFARIYLILHGGPVAAINARLRRLGLPDLRGGDLPANAFPQLRVVWSPLASDNPRVPGNAAQNYYPGAAYVDVEGGDIYDERLADTAPWEGLERLFAAAHARGKPFSVPEWGMIGVDDPAFVRHMCSFAKAHPATELLAYFDSRPGSPFDLEPKPGSSQAYRACLTPLAGELPDWAAGNAPGTGGSVVTLTLTPAPTAGPAPLTVAFAVAAKLTVQIVQWQLLFGDGSQTGGPGPPPPVVPHVFATDGIFDPTLIVYAQPPFQPPSARFLATAEVTVGVAPKKLVAFAARAGRTPLSVVFQTDLNLAERPTSWQLSFGDGKAVLGNGPPPHFNGHTYAKPGTYRVVLTVTTPSGSFVAFADVVVAPAAPPPAQGKPTGTVLVNGSAFTGGPVPFGAKIDVTNGRLALVTDAGSLLVYGNGVAAAFVLVHGKDKGKPIVELRLAGGNFALCGKRAVAGSSGTRASKKVVRQLWGKGKGAFRTRGRYAAAVVRGTFWLTADRCDGTQVTVRQGRVEVSDLVRHTTVSVRAGSTYVARKR
jgi:PKD domain